MQDRLLQADAPCLFPVTSFRGAQLWRQQCHSLNTNQQLLKLHPPEQSRTVTALSCIFCFAPLRALQPSPARQLEAAVEPRVLSAGCWDHGAQRIPPGCSCSCREHVLRSAEQHTAGTRSAYARSNLKARLQKRCYKTQEAENEKGIRARPHKRWKIPGQIVRMACNQAQDPATVLQLQSKPAG